MLLLSLAWALPLCSDAQPFSLPLPDLNVVQPPPLAPSVITHTGQRRLLNDTDVAVHYDESRHTLIVNRPAWWVINYPLTRIRGLEGRSAEDIALLLFGQPLENLHNWYVKTPGTPTLEPSAPTKPAPIDPTPSATLVVNQQHPSAHDGNAGSIDVPLKTIAAAVKRAQPGTVIHVYAGIYRESMALTLNGTADRPIRLEGIPADGGRLPVISGNDPFPPGAWIPVSGLPGVYRAPLFTSQLGPVSRDGQTLIERSLPGDLRADEFCLNRASSEFLNLRLDGQVDPSPGDEQEGQVWRRVQTDPEGFLDLGVAYGERAQHAVVWASTYVWVAPKSTTTPWNPETPATISGRLAVGGEFRAARMTGASLSAQVNKYRVWVNGQMLPSVVYSTEQDLQLWQPHPSRNAGTTDNWDNFALREGWNHLVFQFDTTSRPDKTRFRFGLPEGIPGVVTSAVAPPARDQPTDASSLPYVAEYQVLGPFPAQPDLGVYVRLQGDIDPNTAIMDLSARYSPLLRIQANFVQVRGFEIRHGSQYQQRGHIELKGEGILIEGNLIRDGEVAGIALTADRDQAAAPIVVRNNWVANPGNVGIGGGGDSGQLTAANQDALAPGRTPVLIEHNTVINNNWAGFRPTWSAGGFKFLRLTNAVIRYNTVIAGSGPGIWLDTENYGNRIEGNLLRRVFGYAIGVEASPGPNLLANNLSIGLRPGWDWYRVGLLSWDSSRTWAIHNTLDGLWDPTVWGKEVGTTGINLGQGGARSIRWGPLQPAEQAYINNLIVGSQTAMRPRQSDSVAANFTDQGTGATGMPVTFRDPAHEDYRLVPSSPLQTAGADTPFGAHVGHDFHGLLRFPEDGYAVGAFRREPTPPPGTHTWLEIELQDGQRRRFYNALP
jgi:hypothetical protein